MLAKKRFTKEQLIDLFGLTIVEEPIEPGDLYIAQRNGSTSGAHLLICKSVENGLVVPTTLDYPFNLSECVKVLENVQA